MWLALHKHSSSCMCATQARLQHDEQQVDADRTAQAGRLAAGVEGLAAGGSVGGQGQAPSSVQHKAVLGASASATRAAQALLHSGDLHADSSGAAPWL